MTDNDATRVTVTFRKDTHPDWFEALGKIRSGQARAEFIRSHLPSPGRRQPPQDPGQNPADRSISPESDFLTLATFGERRFFNSSPQSEAKVTGKPGSFEATGNEGAGGGAVHERVNDGELLTKKEGGGLANLMIKSGRDRF